MTEKSLHCSDEAVHKDVLEKVKGSVPSDEDVIRLESLFQLFADDNRLKLLLALRERELCVCDISAFVGMSMSAVSHQLRSLRAAKLVKPRREGKTVYYSLADEHVESIIDLGMEHLSELN